MRSIRMSLAAATVGALFAAAACGARPSVAPTASPPQLAGAWVGEQMLTSLDGADCLDDALSDLLTLPSQFRGTIAQTGARVTATLDVDHTGSTCSFDGTIDGEALTLTSTGCSDARTRGLRCADGQSRDLLPVSEVLEGAIREGVFSGAAVERDDVIDPDTTQRVSQLVAVSTFRLTRQ